MSNIHNIGGNRGGQQGQTIDLAPEDIKEYAACGQCGCETFIGGQRLGVLSQFNPKNPAGIDQFIPIPAIVCSQCGAEFTKPK